MACYVRSYSALLCDIILGWAQVLGHSQLEAAAILVGEVVLYHSLRMSSPKLYPS